MRSSNFRIQPQFAGEDWKADIVDHIARTQDVFANSFEKKEREWTSTLNQVKGKIASLESSFELKEESVMENSNALKAITEELQNVIERCLDSDGQFNDMRDAFALEMQRRMDEMSNRINESLSQQNAAAASIASNQMNERIQALETALQSRAHQEEMIVAAINDAQARIEGVELVCSQGMSYVSEPVQLPVVPEVPAPASGIDMKVWDLEKQVEALQRQVDRLIDESHGERGSEERLEEHEVRLATMQTKVETLLARPVAPEVDLEAEAMAKADAEERAKMEAEAEVQAAAEQEEADRENAMRITNLIGQLEAIVPRVLDHETTLADINNKLESLVDRGQSDKRRLSVLSTARGNIEQKMSDMQDNHAAFAEARNDLEKRLAEIQERQGLLLESIAPMLCGSVSTPIRPVENLGAGVGSSTVPAQMLDDTISATQQLPVLGGPVFSPEVLKPLATSVQMQDAGGVGGGTSHRMGPERMIAEPIAQGASSTSAMNSDRNAGRSMPLFRIDSGLDRFAQNAALGSKERSSKSSTMRDVANDAHLHSTAQGILESISSSTAGLKDMENRLRGNIDVMNNRSQGTGTELTKDSASMTQALLEQFSQIVLRVGENEMRNLELQSKVETHMGEVKQMMGQFEVAGSSKLRSPRRLGGYSPGQASTSAGSHFESPVATPSAYESV